MTANVRQRWSAASPLILGIALVASGAFAQARIHPAFPLNPGRVIPDAQARALHAPQAPDLTQANYGFLMIDPQGQGQCYIDTHGLNDERQVVVSWSTDCNVGHASLWDNGAWTSLDYENPDCPDLTTYFTSLNNREIAFGTWWSSCSYQPTVGVDVKTGKWFTFPDIPGLPYNQGTSMSNTGLAVGAASTTWSFTDSKHWIWNGKKYLFPAFPAGWDVSSEFTGPLWINDWGEMAGQYVDTQSGRMRGYVESRGKIKTFDAPGNPVDTYVYQITNTGTVLLGGSYGESSPYYPWHCFSLTGGVFTALPNVPFPDATMSYAIGLNDRGDISGGWIDTSGLSHGFVAFRK